MDNPPEIPTSVKNGIILTLNDLSEIHDDFIKFINKLKNFQSKLDPVIHDKHLGSLDSNCFEEAGYFLCDMVIRCEGELSGYLLQSERLIQDTADRIMKKSDNTIGEKKLNNGDVLNVSEMRGIILGEKLDFLDNRIRVLEKLQEAEEDRIESKERNQIISELIEKS